MASMALDAFEQKALALETFDRKERMSALNKRFSTSIKPENNSYGSFEKALNNGVEQRIEKSDNTITKYLLEGDKLIEVLTKRDGVIIRDKRGFYSSYDKRLEQCPSEKKGSWTGERGESSYIPNDIEVRNALKAFNSDGIIYKDAVPDFSPFSIQTVRISHMTGETYPNFKQADIECAAIWRKHVFDGRGDWTPRDVELFRKSKKLSWHERCDTETMDLLPQIIHQNASHTGGRYECRIREGEQIGGVFDE